MKITAHLFRIAALLFIFTTSCCQMPESEARAETGPALDASSGEIQLAKALTLEKCKELALANNAKMKNSRLEIEAADQIRRAARTKYYPNISAGTMSFRARENMIEKGLNGGNLPVYDGNLANLASASQFAFFPPMSLGMLKRADIGTVTVTYPVYTGGRIKNGNKLAGLGVEVSKFKSRLSNNEVMLKTEEQYWQIVSFYEKLSTIERFDKLISSLRKQVEDAYQSGVVMKNDVLKVKLKQSELELKRSKLENGITIAKMAFAQYIGIADETQYRLEYNLVNNFQPEKLYVDNNKALSSRAEYHLLKKSVEAEDLQTRLKRGEYMPQVVVGGGGMYMNIDESGKSNNRFVYAAVQIPLSDWHEASHTLKEREQKEKMAENNRIESSNLLLVQMKKAWCDLNDARKQVMICEEAKAQAEENLKVNNDSYQNGLVTVSDLLEAQAMLQQEADKLVDAKVNYRINETTYLQVTGK